MVLGDRANNQIIGDAPTATLTNVNDTISGAGIIGAGAVNPQPSSPILGLVLVFAAACVINATGANALIIDTGPNVVTNAGLLESTGPGGLILEGVVNNAGGTIKGNAASSVILSNATIEGGTLTSVSTGAIRTAGGSRGDLLDGTVSAVSETGTLVITDNSSLNLQGTLTNSGILDISSVGNTTALIVTAKNAAINGGKIVLSDNANNQIDGTVTGPRGSQVVSSLTNTSVISGSGSIGANLALNNAGTIDATGATRLNLTAGNAGNAGIAGSTTLVNSGLLEATNPSKLTAAGGLYLRRCHSCQRKHRQDRGQWPDHPPSCSTTQRSSRVNLITASGGVIETQGGTLGSALDGTTTRVTNAGTFNVTDNSALTINGTIFGTPTGKFDLNSAGNTTALVVGAESATVQGGTVVMDDNGNNLIEGTISGARGAQTVSALTNDTTISGAGSIGSNLILRKRALHQRHRRHRRQRPADRDGRPPLVAGSNSVVNAGLLESTNAGNKLTALGGS